MQATAYAIRSAAASRRVGCLALGIS